MILEVDVKPLTPRSAGLPDRNGDQLRADSLPSCTQAHDGVDDERMDPTIPGDVDEPNEIVAIPSSNPAEAVGADLRLPVVVEDAVIERLGVECVQGGIVEVTSPLEATPGHGATLPGTATARVRRQRGLLEVLFGPLQAAGRHGA